MNSMSVVVVVVDLCCAMPQYTHTRHNRPAQAELELTSNHFLVGLAVWESRCCCMHGDKVAS